MVPPVEEDATGRALVAGLSVYGSRAKECSGQDTPKCRLPRPVLTTEDVGVVESLAFLDELSQNGGGRLLTQDVRVLDGSVAGV